MVRTVLATERLRLRPLTPGDEPALFEVFADPAARRFYPRMASREAVRGWIEWNLRNYAAHGLGLWAVEPRAGGPLIGDCGLTYQDVEGRRELEIGYHVLAAERCKGYATEAARACLGYAFAATQAPLVCSIVDPANDASRTVASRVHRELRTILRGDRPLLLFYTERPRGEVQPCGPGS